MKKEAYAVFTPYIGKGMADVRQYRWKSTA